MRVLITVEAEITGDVDAACKALMSGRECPHLEMWGGEYSIATKRVTATTRKRKRNAKKK